MPTTVELPQVASELRLTPGGALNWPNSTIDWREAWFRLAAERRSVDSAVERYWQTIAQRFLTSLCHVPPGAVALEVEAPTPAELDTLVLSAPPMTGGEYLSSRVLLSLWDALAEWVKDQTAGAGGLAAFLEQSAPKWNRVGRVCFHLAENKQDEERPFAFLATYSTGFGATGRLKHLPLRKALEQYAGERNKQALVKLLTPVQQAAERCDWVAEMVETGAVYRATAWSVEQAYRFLSTAPQLEESGLTVKLPNWWKRKPRPQVSVTIGEQKGGVNAQSLLDFQMEVALGDQTLTPEELSRLLQGPDGLVYLKGQWVEVDRERLQQAMAHWQKLERRGEVSFVEGMRLLAGASEDLATQGQEADREWFSLEAGEAVREVLEGLRNPASLTAADSGTELKATLRPYQETGRNWLRFLTRLGLGACLADDMGLGKTIQVLALLLNQKRELGEGTSLLVVPASLLGNWKAEAARFAPSLRLAFAHPSETSRSELSNLGENLDDTDLVITTYSMVTRQDWLREKEWALVILDEAQAIKNPGTRQTKAVKKLSSQGRVALTGTPVENRLGDLWSLFDFLNPGLLGSSKVFKTFVKNLQSRSENQFAPLRKLVSPYILRRLKTDPNVVSDLPEKVETKSFCALTKSQVGLYRKVLDRMREDLERSDGMARRGIVLQSLMRLKQVCNHPDQFTGTGDFQASKSGKFLRLGEICSEIAERQEKVLVFTQFREIIDSLADFLTEVFGRSGLVLHGGTAVKKRSEMVERFQTEDGPPFFILSLKAGGTGLNLTKASHVVHFDRWWNPAVENQATDRAFRIGQKRNVLVHKFVVRGTLEERIDEMISQKQKLADEILSGDSEVNLTELSNEALMELVHLDVSRAQV